MVEFKRARALRAFPFADDGINVRQVQAGSELGLAADVFAGLKADGLVEEAPPPEAKAPVLIATPPVGAGVTRPAIGTVMSDRKTEVVDPEGLAAIAANTAPPGDALPLVDDKKLVLNAATVPQDNDDHAFRRQVEATMAAREAEGLPADPVTSAVVAGGTTVQEVRVDAPELVGITAATSDPGLQAKAEAPVEAGTVEKAERQSALENKALTASVGSVARPTLKKK